MGRRASSACMRRLALLPTLLLACMSPVEAEALRYDEDDELMPDARVLAIPDGERERPVQTEVAETETPTPGTTRYRMTGDGTVDDCIDVHGEGFPAIDRTGEQVAVSEVQWLQLTPLPGSTTLRIIALDVDAHAGESTSILPAGMDTMDARVCRSLRKQVRGAIARANADLAERGFRPMTALAIDYGDVETPADAYLETPAHERPLQVIVQHGEAIARIPGVKVYERHAINRDTGDWLYAVHGDRSTGTVVLTFANCNGDSCTCDPLFTHEIVRWNDATFAALDAHPCADPESEDGRCHPTDYGF
jgi:hypothetical protein